MLSLVDLNLVPDSDPDMNISVAQVLLNVGPSSSRHAAGPSEIGIHLSNEFY